MTAAHVLYAAGSLIARFGHAPNAPAGGCELTGYAITAAVRQAAVDQAAAAGDPHPRLAAWVSADAAVDYLLASLGYDPDEHGPTHGRVLVDDAGRHSVRHGLGDGWAVGLCDQAAALALASSIRTPAAGLLAATEPLSVLAAA